MAILVAFFMGCLGGSLVMAFANACFNTNKINEAYMEGFLAGRNDKNK